MGRWIGTDVWEGEEILCIVMGLVRILRTMGCGIAHADFIAHTTSRSQFLFLNLRFTNISRLQHTVCSHSHSPTSHSLVILARCSSHHHATPSPRLHETNFRHIPLQPPPLQTLSLPRV
jgi:hypothetical protein